MNILLETPRLILREIMLSDREGFFELDSNPEVHRYLGNKPITSLSQVDAIIESVRQQYIDNGIGRWAIIDKSNNAFMGWTGIKFNTKETINGKINYYDLGYRLLQKYWGQGFATESAIASLEYAFTKLNLKEIYAAAHSDNKASNHILQKLGFQFIEEFPYESAIHNWYQLNNPFNKI